MPLPLIPVATEVGVAAASGAAKLMPSLYKLLMVIWAGSTLSKAGDAYVFGDPETKKTKAALEAQGKLAEAERASQREVARGIQERAKADMQRADLKDADAAHLAAVVGAKQAEISAAEGAHEGRMAAFQGMSAVPAIPTFPRAEPYNPNAMFNFGDLIGLNV